MVYAGRVIDALAALAMAVALAAPDDSAAGPGEWGFRPLDGLASAVDPPAFVWRPQKGARTYDLQVAADPRFRRIVHEATGLKLHCHCPHDLLRPGTYYWRYRSIGKEKAATDWSRTRRFRIEKGAVAFPMPARAELLGRIPEGHPRLLLPPDLVQGARQLAADLLKEKWNAIVARCEKLLEDPPDLTEPLKYGLTERRFVDLKAFRKRWWGNRKRVVAVTDSAAMLAFAWLISGEERYGREARRLILAACEWDPTGATGYRYNDEAGMPFAYYTARTYTWLHDYLSEEDRQKIRAVMRVRGEEIYRHLLQSRHIWRPYGSHRNRAWHWLGEVGTAFRGEIEGADDWAWLAHNIFWCAYPVWSDERGGWHEGINYWNSYVGRALFWLTTMRMVYDVDGFEKPYYRNAGDFALYVSPPGETMGGFGDLSPGFRSQRARSLMTVLSRMGGNPHWAWYVQESGGEALPGGYLGFVLGTLFGVQPAAPRDLPSSVLFPGIGVAALHSDLVDRTKDVQFMLKSSPMGSQSHGFEAQNSFLLSVAGDPVFIRTGRRDSYGSAHHRLWMWETKSTNSILVNGKGQEAHTNRPLGRITHFETTPRYDYVVGEAADAYPGRLKRFTRAVLFIKPHAIVIFDALEAHEPSTFQWLLHSPNKMEVDGRTILASGERARAALHFAAPPDLEITQTDRFDPPPWERIKLKQWHLQASTREKRAAVEFVTVIRANTAETFTVDISERDGVKHLSFDVPGWTPAWLSWDKRSGEGSVKLGIMSGPKAWEFGKKLRKK
ncbi:MAG: DUF4962 domain-containing protein [Planctomycetota bacterium]